MRQTRKALIFFLLLWLVFLPAVSALFAQDDKVFFVQRPRLGWSGYYQMEDEERQTPDLETRITNHTFRERVTLETSGWIYRPEITEFHFSLAPELQQEIFRKNQAAATPTESYHRNTSILGYDLGATMLKHKPVSLNLFANRTTGRIDFTDSPDGDIDSETLGTRLRFNNPTLPVSIAWQHRRVDESGFYQHQEDSDEARVNIRHNAANSVTRLNLRYNDSDTTYTDFNAIDISSKTMSTALTNAYFITGDTRVRLDSRIYNLRADYYNLDQDTWMASENLFWTHRKNLYSRYRVDYNRYDFDGAVNREARLSAGLTHLLQDRLTTDLDVAAATNKFENGREDQYQSNLGFLYRRPIDSGSIELGAAYDYGRTNRSGSEKIIPTEERLTLSTAAETFLDKEAIDPGSIVVTDITGSVVYTENIDYRVSTMGPNVIISRNLLGAIADGQQVAVHYSYRINAPYDDIRFGQNYRFSLAMWSFLYLTYAHGRLDQHIVSGEPPHDPLGDRSDTVRLGLVTKWSDTEFVYDDQDRSNGNASVTQSVTQRFYFRPAGNCTLNLTGNIGKRRFTDLDDTERFYSLGSRMDWIPRSWCRLNLTLVHDKVSGDRREERNTELSTTAKLIYRAWTGSVSYRLRDQNDRQNENSRWRNEWIVQFTRHLW